MTSLPPAPVPPPLPAMLASGVQGGHAAKGMEVQDGSPACYMHAGRHALRQYMLHRDREGGRGSHDSDLIFISYYTPVVPVIQNGPSCGLVALAMASQLVSQQKVSTEQLLNHSITLGHTKQGEMFSAAVMASLVENLLDLNFDSEVVCPWDEKQMLHYLLHGDFLLVPYDADKNHSPCIRSGHKAHWMLITGFFVAISRQEMTTQMDELEEHRDSQYPRLFHLQPFSSSTESTLTWLRNTMEAIKCTLVLAHQGKSKYAGAWILSDVYTSNHQLTEIGPEKTEDEFVIPEGGVWQGLCGKIVRIFKRNISSKDV